MQWHIWIDKGRVWYCSDIEGHFLGITFLWHSVMHGARFSSTAISILLKKKPSHIYIYIFMEKRSGYWKIRGPKSGLQPPLDVIHVEGASVSPSLRFVSGPKFRLQIGHKVPAWKIGPSSLSTCETYHHSQFESIEDTRAAPSMCLQKTEKVRGNDGELASAVSEAIRTSFRGQTKQPRNLGIGSFLARTWGQFWCNCELPPWFIVAVWLREEWWNPRQEWNLKSSWTYRISSTKCEASGKIYIQNPAMVKRSGPGNISGGIK